MVLNGRILTWKASKLITGLPRIVSGKGVWLTDDHNKQYFDLTSQAVCCNLGHTTSDITFDRITSQLKTLPFVYGGLASIPIVEKLVFKMAEITPSHMTGFLFPSSGSEANEAAIRIARLYTGKRDIVTVASSYHGGTALSLASGADDRRKYVIGDVNDVVQLDHVALTIDEICNYLTVNRGTIAAFLFESIIGSGGVYKHSDDWMKRISDTCNENDILMISDEVMSGFGRCGRMWAHERYNESRKYGSFLKPDLMTFAKGFTSSILPMSGVALSSKLHNHYQTNSIGYGSTYQCHPISAGVALSTIERIENENILANVQKNEVHLRKYMNRIAGYPIFRHEFRLYGMFGCFDMVAPSIDGNVDDNVNHPSVEITTYFANMMRYYGVIHMFRPPLFHIAPPLISTETELDDVFDRIESAIIDTVDKYYN